MYICLLTCIKYNTLHLLYAGHSNVNQTSEVDLPPYVDYLSTVGQQSKDAVRQEAPATSTASESSAKEPEVRLVLRIQPTGAAGASGGGKETTAAATGCVLMDDDKCTIFKYAQTLALQSAQHSLINRPAGTATASSEGGSALEAASAAAPPSTFDYLSPAAPTSGDLFNTNSAFMKSVGDTLKGVWDLNFMCALYYNIFLCLLNAYLSDYLN